MSWSGQRTNCIFWIGDRWWWWMFRFCCWRIKNCVVLRIQVERLEMCYGILLLYSKNKARKKSWRWWMMSSGWKFFILLFCCRYLSQSIKSVTLQLLHQRCLFVFQLLHNYLIKHPGQEERFKPRRISHVWQCIEFQVQQRSAWDSS